MEDEAGSPVAVVSLPAEDGRRGRPPADRQVTYPDRAPAVELGPHPQMRVWRPEQLRAFLEQIRGDPLRGVAAAGHHGYAAR